MEKTKKEQLTEEIQKELTKANEELLELFYGAIQNLSNNKQLLMIPYKTKDPETLSSHLKTYGYTMEFNGLYLTPKVTNIKTGEQNKFFLDL